MAEAAVVLRGATGAIWTASTAAMRNILVVGPLRNNITVPATKSHYRIKFTHLRLVKESYTREKRALKNQSKAGLPMIWKPNHETWETVFLFENCLVMTSYLISNAIANFSKFHYIDAYNRQHYFN